MKVQIQTLVFNFINENPGTQISTLMNSLPDINPSSVYSALKGLKTKGQITRRRGKNKQFTYRVAAGASIPTVAKPEPIQISTIVTTQGVISLEEWECRFSEAEALLEKGLLRRASRAFLELLDVTSETNLRDRIIRCRARCGRKPSGDDSMIAGRFAGEYL